MNKFRQMRVNEAARVTLSDILRTVKDPRVTSSFVTITAVNISRDMKFGKVYFSCITGDPKEVKKGLYSAQGFIRSSLATKLNLRITPELTFEYDDSAEKGARIESVLKTLNVNKDEEISGESDE
ncbi:MAG: 30S ribosome-binding factor RbfA [Ruminococcaceae bacterium]|nr:30S ribosome-binding factor RbfA [Oscillospiraceae bacterium]